MNCLMVFDQLNDLIYKKYNSNFEEHARKIAIAQGLLEDCSESSMDNNVLIQLFAPVVSSHRIMHLEFGNPYRNISFKGSLQISFNEFMGYLFITISNGPSKLVDISVNFARYLCGLDISLLANDENANIFGHLIDTWLDLRQADQTILVEAVEQLVVNSDISSACLTSLKQSISYLSVHPECSKAHALLFVDNKFLSLFSSLNAKPLSASDILFVIILTHCISGKLRRLESFQVYLSGPEGQGKSLPHAVHTTELFDNIFLVYLLEVGETFVTVPLHDAFYHLHRLMSVQGQRDKELIETSFGHLDVAIKKLADGLKKSKNKMTGPSKELQKKWHSLKQNYKEYLQPDCAQAINLRVDTLTVNLRDDLKRLFDLTVDDAVFECSAEHVRKSVRKVAQDLLTFKDYFRVKSIKNFSLGSTRSYFLTVSKYLEAFPGLVHFLYVDRNSHRITTPALDLQEDKAQFIHKHIWSMISFAHKYLQQGHKALVWRDKMFTYGYFLWFEDNSGNSMKNANLRQVSSKSPGILEEDYYLRLKKLHFPKMSPTKVRAYELYVMYLGLTTASSVLEQTRRLAATVWELKSFSTLAIDLL